MTRHVSKILAFLYMFTLAGCNDPIRVGALPVPPEYLTCKAEPAVPAQPAPEERDGVLARYIVALRDAGASCRDQLAAVKLYVEQSN